MKKCNCFICNKIFLRKASQIKRAKYNYCSMKCRNVHYSLIRTGSNNYKWKGGEIVRKDGYILKYSPNHPNNRNGYVLKHRLIMETKLNRFLDENEVVHHVNHSKTDNRIENLLLTTQSIHIRKHLPEMMLNRQRDESGRWLPK